MFCSVNCIQDASQVGKQVEINTHQILVADIYKAQSKKLLLLLSAPTAGTTSPSAMQRQTGATSLLSKTDLRALGCVAKMPLQRYLIISYS